MQTIFRIGIQKAGANRFLVVTAYRCIATRSAPSQISSPVQWPWARHPSSPQTAFRSCSQLRHYSDNKDDGSYPIDQQIPDSQRKIPRMTDAQIHILPPPFSSVFFFFKVRKLQKYEPDFTIDEFIEGTKEAAEVRTKYSYQLFRFCSTVERVIKCLLLFRFRLFPISWRRVILMDCVAWSSTALSMLYVGRSNPGPRNNVFNCIRKVQI